MSAIEKITAKTKQIHLAGSGEDGPDVIEVPVWNGTVANLTLMALGREKLSFLQLCTSIYRILNIVHKTHTKKLKIVNSVNGPFVCKSLLDTFTALY